MRDTTQRQPCFSRTSQRTQPKCSQAPVRTWFDCPLLSLRPARDCAPPTGRAAGSIFAFLHRPLAVCSPRYMAMSIQHANELLARVKYNPTVRLSQEWSRCVTCDPVWTLRCHSASPKSHLSFWPLSLVRLPVGLVPGWTLPREHMHLPYTLQIKFRPQRDSTPG